MWINDFENAISIYFVDEPNIIKLESRLNFKNVLADVAETEFPLNRLSLDEFINQRQMEIRNVEENLFLLLTALIRIKCMVKAF